MPSETWAVPTASAASRSKDVGINAVEQRPGNLRDVALDEARRANAVPLGVGEKAAWLRITSLLTSHVS